MKKIVMIFAAMAAVLSSCQKSELESVSANDGKDIVLNISVSNPGADDTKAIIKTGWAENDEISIWYDTNADANPDLVIIYNGTKWIQKAEATVSGNTPSTGTGKYAKALYNGKVKVASKDDYTYENSTLTFSIENWKFLTEIQVVVKGLTSASAGNYTLACDKFTPLAAGNGYTVGSDAITASAGTKGAAVTGIPNTDEVAFVFATAEYSSTAADYKFVLKDNTSGSEVTKVYKRNVAIAEKEGKSSIKALAIASTSFVDPVIPEFVDFGLTSGLEWRSWNLGASKPEEYGTYFQWGETTGHECNGTTSGSIFKDGYDFKLSNNPFHPGSSSGWTKYIPSGKSSYWSGTGSPDNKSVLESDDDAAYQADPNTSKSWRMPTTGDFVELFNGCYAEWGTYKGVNGLIVYKARSADDKGYAYFNSEMNQYTGSGNTWDPNTTKTRPSYSTDFDTFVFFPAAGLGVGTSLGNAGSYGYYWSSSLNTDYPNNAYTLYFNSGSVDPQDYYGRDYGFSVRPVSD